MSQNQHTLLVLNLGDTAEAAETSAPKVKFESLQVTNLPSSYVELHSAKRPPHLLVPPNHDTTPNLHVIVSVRSGIGKAQDFYEDVLKNAFHAVELGDTSYRLYITESENFITDLARTIFLPRANEGISQTILLLSGDGGIVDLMNALLSSPQTNSYVKPVIGLLVLGTGNALANSTGINRGSTQGLRTLFKGRPHSLPIFTAKFSPGSEFMVDEGQSTEPLPKSDEGFVVHGAVVCSWAFHASLVADSDTTEYRKYGSERFPMAGKELLMPSDGSAPHIYQGKITFFKQDQEGHEHNVTLDRREHMYILASLVSNLEEKFVISPHSKPLDGQLWLLHFGALSSAEMMRIMGLAYQGGLHVEDEAVCYDNISGLRIDLDEADSRWRRICVDGKIVRVNEGGWVEIRKEKRDILDIVAEL